MKQKILTLIISLVCYSVCIAQTGTTTTTGTTPPATTPPAAQPVISNPTSLVPGDFDYDKVPVTYTFGSGTNGNSGAFDKVLPFDRGFVIHFAAIPAEVSFIEVTITNDNTKKFRHPEAGTYNDESLDKYSVNYVLKKWERPAGVTGVTTGDVLCRFKLLPNTGYSIKIQTGVNSTLTQSQQDQLKTQLAGNPQISAAISNMIQTALTFNLDAGKAINQQNKNTIALFKTAVATVNPNYKLSGFDQTAATVAFANLLNNFLIITDNLKSIDDFTSKDKTFGDANKKTKTLLDDIKSNIDWGKFVVNNVDDKAITKALDDVSQLYSAAANHTLVDLFIANIKAKLALVAGLRDALAKEYIDKVIVPNTTVYVAQNDTYVDNFSKNAKLYFSLDMGYAYVFKVDRGLAYSGLNIYFRPVNKSIPLKQYNSSFGEWMAVRSSLLIGVTLASIAQENVRKGFLGDNALVVGYGLKLIPAVKINTGAMVHYRYNTNPLVNQSYHTSLSPFVSLSVDLDAQSLFSGIGTSLFK